VTHGSSTSQSHPTSKTQSLKPTTVQKRTILPIVSVKERQKTKVVVLFSFEEQRRAKERKDLREITNEIENKRRALYYCTNQGSEITMSLFFTSLPLPVISFLPLDPESRVCDLRRVRRRG